MILLIDNYDSFTFNLVHFLGDLGVACTVRRNDALSAPDALALHPEAIVLSPGPRTPNEAGICLDLIAAAADARIPLLGVCLGHQAIGQAFGARVIRAPEPVHGKTSEIFHRENEIFAGLPTPFIATRYHSLMIAPETLPPTLQVTAKTSSEIIMGLSHRDLPIFGVQFHPESIATTHGHDLLENFLRIAGVRRAKQAAA